MMIGDMTMTTTTFKIHAKEEEDVIINKVFVVVETIIDSKIVDSFLMLIENKKVTNCCIVVY